MEYAGEDSRIEVVALVSDKPDAPALERARHCGVPAHHIAHNDVNARMQLLGELKPDWALLAGYMRILGNEFLQLFRDEGFYRVLNIHPSLLPAFTGLKAQQQAFAAGVKISGVTVHLVDEGVDTGLPVLQAAFERGDNDSFEDFCRRGKLLEHELYTRALSLIADNRIRIGVSRDLPGEPKFINTSMVTEE